MLVFAGAFFLGWWVINRMIEQRCAVILVTTVRERETERENKNSSTVERE
jgi:hypothetical protein